MSIRIDRVSCVGCGRCVEVCPGNLLYQDDLKKAQIKLPKDCWGCTACLKECRAGAIQYFLGPDIGGEGTYLYTRGGKECLYWHFVKGQDQKKVITINRKDANKY